MTNWQVGQEHVMEITGLSHEAAGVGRIDGRVVFVPETIPGDRALVRLVHLKKSLGFGEMVDLLRESPQRKERSCPHALTCGGCQLQHMDYAAQLSWKRQQVVSAMERIGGLNVEVLPVLGMEKPYCYRNKAQLPLGEVQGELVMGFFRKGSHDIVDLESCEIQHPLLTRLALVLKRTLKELEVEPYDEINHVGLLRHAVLRVSFSEETLMLVLVTRTAHFPARTELIHRLTQEVPELVSVAHNVNPGVTNVILGPQTRVVWGEPYLMDSIGHVQYAISPGSFFQVNPKQTKVLYDLVREKMQLDGGETLFDLYCGAGTIGLYLASQVKAVLGVETFARAVHDARYNARLNRIQNAQFYQGKAEDVLPKLLRLHGPIDGVILDPPRKGCERSLLETLIEAEIPAIVYVSCNPATLARDLARLASGGYTVGHVQPVDMFPWTRHVECVVLMSRVEK